MKLSVFEIGRQLWQLRIGRGGSHVLVFMRELMMAGIGKKTRKRSVRTFRLPSTTRGAKDSRHFATDFQQCSSGVKLYGSKLTSWIWYNLPCGLRQLVDDYLTEKFYLSLTHKVWVPTKVSKM